MPVQIPRQPSAAKRTLQQPRHKTKGSARSTAAATQSVVPTSPLPGGTKSQRGASPEGGRAGAVYGPHSAAGSARLGGINSASSLMALMERDPMVPPQYLSSVTPPPSRQGQGQNCATLSGRLSGFNGTLGAATTASSTIGASGLTPRTAFNSTQSEGAWQQQTINRGGVGAGGGASGGRVPTVPGETATAASVPGGAAPPTYLVGNAILNPYVPVSPSVQQEVRGVRSIVSLPDTATRPRIGAQIMCTAEEERRAQEQQQQQQRPQSLLVEHSFGIDLFGTNTAANSYNPSSAQGRQSSHAIVGGHAISGETSRQSPPVSRSLSGTTKRQSRMHSPAGSHYPHSRLGSHRMSIGEDSMYASYSGAGLVGERRTGSPEAESGVAAVMLDAVPVSSCGPLVRVTDIITNVNRRLPVALGTSGGNAASHEGVRVLRELYGTTDDDVLPEHALEPAGAVTGTALQVLPELSSADERARELITIRRHIDWDVTIPTASTIPPPVIAFLDAEGHPAPHAPTIVFVLDAVTQTLSREEGRGGVAANGISNSNNTTLGPLPSSRGKLVGGGAEHLGKPRCGAPTSTALTIPGSGMPMSNAAAAAAEQQATVGTCITHNLDGAHRIHGLVGLMRGLAEKVGLERVMEYQVQTQVEDLFLAPPYVDAETGDLVLELNASLQGTIKMSIIGYDCASVDVATGQVKRSSNTLSCMIKVKYAGDGRGRSRQEQQQLGNHTLMFDAQGTNMGSAGLTQGERRMSALLLEDAAATARKAKKDDVFVFPSTNPHELRYEEIIMTTNKFLVDRLIAQHKATNNQLHVEKENEKATAAAAVVAALKQRQQQQQQQQQPSPKPSSPTVAERPFTADEDLEKAEKGSIQAEVVKKKKRDNNESHLDDDCDSEGSGASEETANNEMEDDDISGVRYRPSTSFSEDGRKRASLKHTGDKPFNGHCRTGDVEMAINGEGLDNALLPGEQDLREVFSPLLSFFPSGSLQSPLGHFCIASWQDGLSSVFREGDTDLYSEETRTLLKKNARQELSTLGIQSLRTRGESSSRVVPSFTSKRGGAGHSTGAPVITGSTVAQSTSEASINMLRRLVLCLLLEPNRSSSQLFMDIIELCSHLVRNALLRSMVTTGGTPETLQRAAAALLSGETAGSGAGSSAAAALYGMGRSAGIRTGGQVPMLTEKEHANMTLLIDALFTAMHVMLSIGAIKEAVQYATQRVHALCLVEGDTTITVCAAQKDLAELLLFYGDYSAGRKVAEDVLMLAGQLYDVDAHEVVDMELLFVLAALSSGDLDRRVGEIISKLYHRSRSTLTVTLVAKIKLVVAYARSSMSSFRVADLLGLTAESVVTDLEEVIAMLNEEASPRGSVASVSASGSAGATPPPLPSAYSRPDTAQGLGSGMYDEGRSSIVESRVSTYSAAAAASPIMRRLPGPVMRARWNLLSLASMFLIKSGNTDAGIKVLERIVQELMLGQGNVEEQRLRSELAAVTWVTLAMWKMWARPTDYVEARKLLKYVVQHLTLVKGPLHPVAAAANLMYAHVVQVTPRSHALSVATRSMSVIQRSVSSRSALLLVAHRICSRINGLANRWKPAIEHASAALVIAQANKSPDEMMCRHEAELLGCLLRAPPSAAVRIDADLLLRQLQERIVRLESGGGGSSAVARAGFATNANAEGYGPHSTQLITPLANLAEAYYLLRHYEDALVCLQRAIRIADPKGALFVTTAVLKPTVQLSTRDQVEQRDQMVRGVLQTTDRVLQLSHLLFAMAAVLEAVGSAADALDCYSRCLALLECVKADGCLASVRVYAAIARLLHTSGEYGDALGWARRAQRAVREEYKEWPSELAASRSLLNVVEDRIRVVEGTYVIVNPHCPHRDFVELI